MVGELGRIVLDLPEEVKGFSQGLPVLVARGCLGLVCDHVVRQLFGGRSHTFRRCLLAHGRSTRTSATLSEIAGFDCGWGG